MSATPSKAPDAARGKEKAAEGTEVKKDDEIAKAAAETKAKVDEATKHKPVKEVLEDLKNAPDAAGKKEVLEGLHLSVEEAKKDDVKKEFKDAVKGEKDLEALVDKVFHDAAHAKEEKKDEKHPEKDGHSEKHGDDHGGAHGAGHGDAHGGHDAHGKGHDDHGHGGHGDAHPPKVSYGFTAKMKNAKAANDNQEDETKPPGVFKSFATPIVVPTKTSWQVAKTAGAFGLGMVPFLGKWFIKNYQGPKPVKVKLPVKEPEFKKKPVADIIAHDMNHAAANDDHAEPGDHGHEKTDDHAAAEAHH